MLDEIARLREFIGREHASHCVLLREDAPCDCGRISNAVATLLENRTLVATLAQAQKIIQRQNLEIGMLSLRMHAEREGRTLPVNLSSYSTSTVHP